MNKDLLVELDKEEKQLIEKFRFHPVLKGVSSIDEDVLGNVLMQRRFISMYFTPMYDLAIDTIESDSIRVIARKIVRDEYPGIEGKQRSHREWLFCDLVSLGIPKEDILKSRKSEETRNIISKMFDLILSSSLVSRGDLGIVSVLRSMLEVLVSIEYREYQVRMESMGLSFSNNKEKDKVRSKFFYPHVLYDSRTSNSIFDVGPNNVSHSDQLTKALCELVIDQASLDEAKKFMRESTELKYRFYDQFLGLV